MFLVISGFTGGIQYDSILPEFGVHLLFFGGVGGDGGRPATGLGADGVEQTPERRPEQAGEVCNGAAEC